MMRDRRCFVEPCAQRPRVTRPTIRPMHSSFVDTKGGIPLRAETLVDLRPHDRDSLRYRCSSPGSSRTSRRVTGPPRSCMLQHRNRGTALGEREIVRPRPTRTAPPFASRRSTQCMAFAVFSAFVWPLAQRPLSELDAPSNRQSPLTASSIEPPNVWQDCQLPSRMICASHPCETSAEHVDRSPSIGQALDRNRDRRDACGTDHSEPSLTPHPQAASRSRQRLCKRYRESLRQRVARSRSRFASFRVAVRALFFLGGFALVTSTRVRPIPRPPPIEIGCPSLCRLRRAFSSTIPKLDRGRGSRAKRFRRQSS